MFTKKHHIKTSTLKAAAYNSTSALNILVSKVKKILFSKESLDIHNKFRIRSMVFTRTEKYV